MGSPRSGTTLLQSLLFAHDSVLSFPETFFFLKVVPSDRDRWLRRWLRRYGLASLRAPKALRQLAALGLLPNRRRRAALPPLTVAGYARLFSQAMEAAARAARASLWLEKTPDHLLCLAEIDRHLPQAKVVHMIRSGEAVVASLYDVTQRYPDVWLGGSSADALVGAWRSNLHRSLAYVGRPNHAFVSYERLVDDTEGVLARLCAFLGLPADGDELEQLLTDYRSCAPQLTRRLSRGRGGIGLVEEPWKATVADPISNRNRSKFESLFTPDEQAEISAAVAREDHILHSFPFL